MDKVDKVFAGIMLVCTVALVVEVGPYAVVSWTDTAVVLSADKAFNTGVWEYSVVINATQHGIIVLDKNNTPIAPEFPLRGLVAGQVIGLKGMMSGTYQVVVP